MFISHFAHDPVIERPVIFKFKRTDGMGNSLHGILNRMCKIVHRVDAPFVFGVVMMHMGHAVNDRIPHVDIRGSHIDSGAEYFFTVCKFSFPHLFK